MKTNLQILYMLKDRCEKPEFEFMGGLCLEVIYLQGGCTLTHIEGYNFSLFMNKNRPKKTRNTEAWWWHIGLKPPRLKWINDMIEQQESKRKTK